MCIRDRLCLELVDVLVERADGALGADSLDDSPHHGRHACRGQDEQRPRFAEEDGHHRTDPRHDQPVAALVVHDVALVHQLRPGCSDAGEARLGLAARPLGTRCGGSATSLRSRAFPAGQVLVCLLEVLELLGGAVLELLDVYKRQAPR